MVHAVSSRLLSPIPLSTEGVYGKVNSVEKHNYKMWLNDGVY